MLLKRQNSKTKHLFPGILIVLLACSICARAQYRFDHWTADDGLPQNSVYGIVQTNDGYLWFTTFDGLVRFDGVNFAVFNRNNTKGLTGNRILSLFAEAMTRSG